MIEGAFIPFLAKMRWPQINVKTSVVFSDKEEYRVPYIEEDWGWAEPSTVERWRSLPESTTYGMERILLDRVRGVPGLKAVGYGEHTNTLVLLCVPEEV